jgi:signal transduction histidine kinase
MEPAADQIKNMEIEGDSEQLHQVLINLIGNAIKFTPNGGKVGCQLVREENTVTVRIWDTGRGISPENLARVFERFYQEDASSTREVPGTGIGLAIVRSIVEMHGGKPWFESELGKGTSCFLRLPIRQEAQKQVAV